MADMSMRGRYRPRAAPRPGDSSANTGMASVTSEPTANQIFRMPTMEEVVKAGYPRSRWVEIKREHTEVVRRFQADPEFRARVIAEWKARR